MGENRGFYILLINLKESMVVRRGRRKFNLPKGFYLYVGSAMNSLCGRVKYHLSDRKSGRWHVDEVLKDGKATVELAILVPSKRRLERKLSMKLADVEDVFEVVEGFGSTDVKTKGNLFRVMDIEKVVRDLLDIVLEIKRGSE